MSGERKYEGDKRLKEGRVKIGNWSEERRMSRADGRKKKE